MLIDKIKLGAQATFNAAARARYYSAARFNFLILATFIAGFSYTPQSQANAPTGTLHLPMQLLSEVEAKALAPAPFLTEDYQLSWSKPLPKDIDVKLQLVPNSLQWVRVNEVMVLPRALASITASGIEGGGVSTPGHIHAIEVKNGRATTQFMVALMSGADNTMTVTIKKNGLLSTGEFQVKFSPRATLPKDRVFFDISCARRNLKIDLEKLRDDQWLFISCNSQRVKSNDHLTANLLLNVYWENPGPKVEINNVETPPKYSGVWVFELSSDVTSVSLVAGESQLVLTTPLAERIHLGSFALGEGPYSSNFQSMTDSFSGLTSVTTLYGSYSIDETTRAVFFGAITASPQTASDFGLYLELESSRALDTRLSLNVLLGLHGLGYQSAGQYNGRIDVPQGFEIIYRGAFKPTSNISAGGFVQPSINSKSYYNLWLRWATPAFFVEANYIYWTDETSQPYLTRNAGLTFGIPLFKFL